MLVGGGEGCGGATVRVWDGHVHTAVFKKENNKDALSSTGNSAWTGGESGGEGTRVCVWLSPVAIRPKLSQHC